MEKYKVVEGWNFSTTKVQIPKRAQPRVEREPLSQKIHELLCRLPQSKSA